MPSDTHHNDTRLRELGFDSTAPPTEALATLNSLRSREGVEEALIAHALGGIASSEAAAMLVAMEPGASGELRREIRRALFRLRHRGIEVPPAAAPLVNVQPPSVDSDLSALISPADADGARIVWLLKARNGGGLRRIWGLVSENQGLVAATLENLSRKEFRAQRADVERRAGTSLFDAAGALADFMLCEAYRRTPEARRGRVGNFLAIRAELVAGSPPADFRHPVYQEMAGQLSADPSAELMKEPELGAFHLPPAAIKPYIEEVTGLQQSVIVLSRMQQQERVAMVVERALGDLLTGELRHRLQRYLEDTAYILARSGKLIEAGWAAAAAARLRDGIDLKRLAFFQAFMRAQLGALLAEQNEEARDEPRLIMTPAEAMRARQAAQARRRPR